MLMIMTMHRAIEAGRATGIGRSASRVVLSAIGHHGGGIISRRRRISSSNHPFHFNRFHRNEPYRAIYYQPYAGTLQRLFGDGADGAVLSGKWW